MTIRKLQGAIKLAGWAAAAGLFGLATAAQGATISGNAADDTFSVVRTDGATYDAGTSGTADVVLQNNSTTDAVLQVGGTSGNASIATAFAVFQLPTLPAGQSFTSASFSIGQTTASIGQQIDLYGLGRRASATVLASDYYRGTTGGDTTDSTLIQAAFVATTDSFGADAITTTSTSGGAALAAYLNAEYAAGAGAGQYVFLRMNVTDTFSTANTRLDPAAEEETAPAGLQPVITYATPEPASAGLLGIAAVGLLGRRRRSARR